MEKAVISRLARTGVFACSILVASIFVSQEASAQHGGHGLHYGGYSAHGNIYGHGGGHYYQNRSVRHYPSYRNSNYYHQYRVPSHSYYPPARAWHDTSHLDWQRGGYVPHNGHLDYVPGGWRLHQTGHWDYRH